MSHKKTPLARTLSKILAVLKADGLVVPDDISESHIADLLTDRLLEISNDPDMIYSESGHIRVQRDHNEDYPDEIRVMVTF